MNKLHENILVLLHEIDAICKKYNVTYYAAGGTTIGAVRHKGFIPWDDDADLYMTRDNFKRFREAFKIECPKNRALECSEDNLDYTTTIPRYIDKTSTYLTRVNCLNSFVGGTLIDIFILDPIPNDKQLQLDQRAYLSIYSDIINPFYGYSYRNREEYDSLYFDYMNKLKKDGKQKTLAELEKILFTYPEQDASFYMLRWGTLSHIFDRDMFEEPVYYQYEDFQIPCPTRTYDYLVQLYGRMWVEVPPAPSEEKHTCIIDFDHPYTYYFEGVDKYINKNKILDKSMIRKDCITKRTVRKRNFDDFILKQHSTYILTKYKIEIFKNIDKLKKMISESDYASILNFFDLYIKTQLSIDFIGKMQHVNMYRFYNPVYINLESDYLLAILMSLLQVGQLKKADVLESLYLQNSETVSSTYDKIKSYKDSVLTAIKAYYEEDFSNAVELFDKNIELVKKSPFMLEMYYLSKVNNSHDRQYLFEIIQEINSLGNNALTDEMKKALGDAYYNLGEKDKATEIYQDIITRTRNGIFLLDIQRKLGHKISVTDIDHSGIIVNDIQSVQLKLLAEIDEICKANNIEYVLSGYVDYTERKYVGLSNAYQPFSIMMKPEEALKFENALKKNLAKNRRFTSSRDDINLLLHGYRYESTDTVYFTIYDYYNNNFTGMYIQIFILESDSNNPVVNKTHNIANRIIRISQRNLLHHQPKRGRFKTRFISWLFSVPGNKLLTKMLFDSKIKHSLSSRSSKYHLTYIRINKKINRKSFSKKVLDSIKYVEIANKGYPVCQDTDNQLEHFSHLGLINNLFDMESRMIIEKDLSIDEFNRYYKFDDISDEIYDEYYSSYICNIKLAQVNKDCKLPWQLLCHKHDLVEMYKYYHQENGTILQMIKQNKQSDLAEEFDMFYKVDRGYDNYDFNIEYKQEFDELYCKYANKFPEDVPKKLKKKYLENNNKL